MKTVLRLYHSHLVCLALGLMIGSLGLVHAGAIQRASPSQLSADSSQIAVLRYFKIKKGSFPEVYRLSTEGIWPYYERAGARIVGMWQGIYPDLPGLDILHSRRPLHILDSVHRNAPLRS